ncbi:MAG TPA: LytR C-terminal domain-containing protein [Solirubrobacterales bacterium]|nr:LytR C-terminal domain-containing protein [Solirubrobacterales bacterium]
MSVSGDIYDALLDLPAWVSVAATLAFFLLLTLYLSQRRDVARLSAWMAQAPSHPATDLAASETLLDRAEAELEALLGAAEPEAAEPESAEPESAEPEAAEPEAAEAVEPTAVAPPPPVTPSQAPARDEAPAARVTAERPALERITMERAALLPHPRWRRLTRKVGQPRVLGLIALAAVVLGLVAIFGSERLLRNGEGSSPPSKTGKVDPAAVTVAVLNGTSVPALAAKTGDDVKANDFKVGTLSNSRKQYQQTVVMYEPHQQRAANKVAHDLGVKPVQPIDRQTQGEAGDADVVVIAGADRTQP